MKVASKVIWTRNQNESFLDGKYSRVHQWQFDGGKSVEASSSPEVVPVPMSDPSLIDPEEAFITSISSCHMLFFLSIAAKKRLVVEAYEDNPKAFLGENEIGKQAIVSLKLQPKIKFGGSKIPTKETINRIHKMAHSNCFLAKSVNFNITFD